MPGLGNYSKGKKFTLKSGNKPAFKMMAGKSPITSPYKQDEEKEKGAGWKKAGKILKNVAKVGVAAVTSGLDAAYGSGKVKMKLEPTVEKKAEDQEKTLSEKLISGDGANTSTINTDDPVNEEEE